MKRYILVLAVLCFAACSESQAACGAKFRARTVVRAAVTRTARPVIRVAATPLRVAAALRARLRGCR